MSNAIKEPWLSGMRTISWWNKFESDGFNLREKQYPEESEKYFSKHCSSWEKGDPSRLPNDDHVTFFKKKFKNKADDTFYYGPDKVPIWDALTNLSTSDKRMPILSLEENDFTASSWVLIYVSILEYKKACKIYYSHFKIRGIDFTSKIGKDLLNHYANEYFKSYNSFLSLLYSKSDELKKYGLVPSDFIVQIELPYNRILETFYFPERTEPSVLGDVNESLSRKFTKRS